MWWNISGEAAGEIWNWYLRAQKRLAAAEHWKETNRYGLPYITKQQESYDSCRTLLRTGFRTCPGRLNLPFNWLSKYTDVVFKACFILLKTDKEEKFVRSHIGVQLYIASAVISIWTSYDDDYVASWDVCSWDWNVYCAEVQRTTPRKYVFDVTSVGQRSSPWTCKLSESRDKISPRVQVPFS